MNGANVDVMGQVLQYMAAILPIVGPFTWWIVRQIKLLREHDLKELLGKADAIHAAATQLRENDLRHVDAKLDDMREIMARTEAKIDQHVRDHAFGKGSGA